MPGSQYIALSALRTRLQQLDRLADDLSNVGTIGYRGGRTIQLTSTRAEFQGALRSAVDTQTGPMRLDTSAGTIAPTGRGLDAAIVGDGFFVVETPQGLQYTRNGHFQQGIDGLLVASDGAVVQGTDGPITLGAGEARIDVDGRVWSGQTAVGRLLIVGVPDPAAMARGDGARLLAGAQTPEPLDDAHVQPGALEDSNVVLAEGLARLTSVSRSFEALQRAISTVLNDIDGRFIDHMGRR